jgi:hypothetical protein
MDIATALTGDAASGGYVWWFTSKAQRLAEVESVLLRDADKKDIPLTMYTEAKEYDQGVTDKYVSGEPSAVLVEYLSTKTRVTFNSLPEDATDTVVFTGVYPAEDYDADEDIAFPQEWYGYLAMELTLRSCIKYRAKWTQEMQLNYENARSRAMNLNPENTALYFRCGEAG